MTTEHADLRKLAEAATPGPWFPHRDMLTNDYQVHVDGDIVALVWGTEATPGYDNAAFIAACSPDVITAILDESEGHRLNAIMQKSRADTLAESIRYTIDESIKPYKDRAERAERERDEAIEDRKAARDDAARAAAMLAARTMERDARPEITPEDAAGYVDYDAAPERSDPSALYRVRKALRAHAAKVTR